MTSSRRSLLMDGALFVMVFVWGVNYSVMKAALEFVPPRPFNAARLAIATLVYLAMLGWAWAAGHRHGESTSLMARVLGVSVPGRREWIRIVAVAVVGQFAYHLLFIDAMGKTTAANAALLIGSSPIAVSIATAVAGQERLAREHWMGLLLSFAGVYLVVGRGASLDGNAHAGDLLLLLAVGCWAVYTVLSRPLLDRHSPLLVTAWPLTIGTLAFVAFTWPEIVGVDWSALPGRVWVATVASAVGSFNLCYLIYYVAVQRIGAARTSVWSNVVPLIGAGAAMLLLGERLGALQITGAALILAGVAFTRIASRPTGRAEDPPPEE